MAQLLQAIDEAVAYIRTRTDLVPQYGIILGTGLGNLAKELDIVAQFSYRALPHFPISTVESHSGRLLLGYLGGKPVMVMQGRFHYYEGYTLQEVTFPVRVMRSLGVERLIVSNAAGSVSPHIRTGSLMIIEDHINLLGKSPLMGKNYDELGPRFPDMSQPYDSIMIAIAERIAQERGYFVHKGVYAAVPGPNLETKAEYTYLHRIGADAVGMSTVPEIIVGVHSGMRTFALSAITDDGYPPQRVKPVSLEDVVRVANFLEPQMTDIIKGIIEQLD
ncbi:MAG: purine-nucleoside phosphorylase [Chitinophagales bacterium]|jgi:purine-nucleoside phosphorylase|nr:purine-nucleoside phosphorylase [Chitinophagales bacterium]